MESGADRLDQRRVCLYDALLRETMPARQRLVTISHDNDNDNGEMEAVDIGAPQRVATMTFPSSVTPTPGGNRNEMSFWVTSKRS